ncbi:MAG TPA: monovalent cation/H(+) antiporter subunit G [bacterium]|nr:monovalent cation/H(+) antiporter subunit G [bacterium]
MILLQAIGYGLIVLGVIFDLFGCIGLVRLPDFHNRMHAAMKCVTLGTMSILIGAALASGSGAIMAKALLCALFIAITAPTAAHALSRAAYLSGVVPAHKEICDHYGADRRARGEERS